MTYKVDSITLGASFTSKGPGQPHRASFTSKGPGQPQRALSLGSCSAVPVLKILVLFFFFAAPQVLATACGIFHCGVWTLVVAQ